MLSLSLTYNQKMLVTTDVWLLMLVEVVYQIMQKSLFLVCMNMHVYVYTRMYIRMYVCTVHLQITS